MERLSVDELLERARAGLERVAPAEAADAMRGGALLVDIRPVALREADGEIPGAIVIDRNVLEWRLDPSSAHRIPQVDETQDRDHRVRRGVRVQSGGRDAAGARTAARHRSRSAASRRGEQRGLSRVVAA